MNFWTFFFSKHPFSSFLTFYQLQDVAVLDVVVDVVATAVVAVDVDVEARMRRRPGRFFALCSCCRNWC